VRDDDFAAVAERASVPVLVQLWASWCGLSRQVRPVAERLALTRPGELELVEVDVVSAPANTRWLSVRAVPPLLVLQHGDVIARRYGVAPAGELRTSLDKTVRQRSTWSTSGAVGGSPPPRRRDRTTWWLCNNRSRMTALPRAVLSRSRRTYSRSS
jgi:thioredoxin 2